MVKHITSLWNRHNRNNINNAIDVLNQLGISIQDLVAEGQLTPEQYANLITVIHNMADEDDVLERLSKKRDVDILINMSDLHQNVRESFTGGAVPVVGIDAVGNENLKNKAVSPGKTSFFDISNNLFDSESVIHGQSYDFDGNTISDNSQWISQLIELPQSQLLSVSPQGASYRLFVFDEEGNFIYRTGVQSGDSLIDLTNLEGKRFIVIGGHIDFDVNEIMLNEGSNLLPYEPYYVRLKESYQIELPEPGQENTVTVVEDSNNGYPERPAAVSVIWVGVNEPSGAEPFDEWRETEGFTYFRDFKNENIDGLLEFGTGFDNVTTVSHSGRAALEIQKGSTGINGLIFNNISDDYMNTQEIYLEGETTSNVRSISAIHHSSGNGSDFYAVGFLTDAVFSIGKRTNNGSTVNSLSTTNLDINPRQPFKLRSRFEGGFIKAKVWQSDEAEPRAWTLEYFDANALEPSKNLGIMTFGYNHYLYDIGVSTGGMTAPTMTGWF